MSVVIETTVGDFTVDLYTKERPQTCRNFLKLCKIKYYNWNLFFTVQSNFIAQTGDPTSTGKGGESVYGIVLGEKARYYEAEQIPKIKHDKTGLISMVNCGDNMIGSQFFITLGSDLQSLDGEHCVFGEITEGLEIILKFNETICDVDHRPYQDIRISHTVVLDDPYEDPKELVIPDRSPEPTKEALMSDRIGADETIDDTAGMSIAEITEMQKEKEAKARATILEIVGDIPDAEMAPPENVLFVCKLNPVTNDDDLEIIFSRFGKIVGCEVIRDRQTGDSLQYAFIEFADRKSCEEAYFKMDNVLIDDRRIHVDFSQSVAKMRWRGKGKGIKYFDEENEPQFKRREKLRDYNKNKNERCQSRSESPNKERSTYWDKDRYELSQSDVKKMLRPNNDDEQRRIDKDKRFSRKEQERGHSDGKSKERKGRSKSREKIKERKEKSRERSRDRKDRSRERKERSRERKERSREGRERKGKSRERSRDRSKEGKSRKEKNSQYEYKNRENYYRDTRIKAEKHKKKEYDRKSSDDQDDRHSNNKKPKQLKLKDESEEKLERSGHKHKHKYKSR